MSSDTYARIDNSIGQLWQINCDGPNDIRVNYVLKMDHSRSDDDDEMRFSELLKFLPACKD